MNVTRRDAIGLLAAGTAITAEARDDTAGRTASSPEKGVNLDWLTGKPPATESAVSWGVPWPRGAIQQSTQFVLTAKSGKALPLQSWTTAYWPDGSIKWTGFATVAPAEAVPLRLSPSSGSSPSIQPALRVTESTESVQIQTQALECILPRTGAAFISAIKNQRPRDCTEWTITVQSRRSLRLGIESDHPNRRVCRRNQERDD
jgi:hypothetical protein